MGATKNEIIEYEIECDRCDRYITLQHGSHHGSVKDLDSAIEAANYHKVGHLLLCDECFREKKITIPEAIEILHNTDVFETIEGDVLEMASNGLKTVNHILAIMKMKDNTLEDFIRLETLRSIIREHMGDDVV